MHSMARSDRAAPLSSPGLAAVEPIAGPPAEPPADRQPKALRPSEAVLLRLRSETRALHQQVEQRLFPAALADSARYAAMLAAMLALHEPVERQTAAVATDLQALGLAVAARRKTHRLLQDLEDLGAASSPVRHVELPARVGTLGPLLGAVYVAEGSTLG